MAAEEEHGRRGELAQWLYLGAILAVGVAVDPVQRRNCRLAADRALRSLRRAIDGPTGRLPTPFEISALHTEARRITKESSDNAGT